MIETNAKVRVISRLNRKSICAGRSGVVIESDEDHDVYKIKFDDDGTSFWFDSANVIQIFEEKE